MRRTIAAGIATLALTGAGVAFGGNLGRTVVLEDGSGWYKRSQGYTRIVCPIPARDDTRRQVRKHRCRMIAR